MTVILPAKVRAPEARRASVQRDRAIALLAAAELPLTVVRAPAGYGKTAAIAQWLEVCGETAAWLTLDAGDNDPRRLCAHVLAALERAWPGSVRAAAQAASVGADLGAVVAPLIGGGLASSPDRRVLVLDDVGLITTRESQQFISAVVDALPDGVRVVLAGRTLPLLRLGRRRAAGAIAELGVDALRFDRSETERLLNDAFGLDLCAAQIDAIERRVDGWPAGLALLAAAIADAEPHPREVARLTREAHTLVADYLAEEVLDRLDPELRRFLRRAAILEPLSVPLCSAVLEDPDAPRRLEELRRARLFVTALDGDRLRLHGLFADVLRHELRLHEPASMRPLHLRAARWFERAGRFEDALAHTADAGDGGLAARVLRDGFSGRASAAAAAGRDALDRLHEPSARLRFSGPLAATLWLAGEGPDARRLVEPHLHELAAFPEAHAWALATLAFVAHDERDSETAEHFARSAVAGLDELADAAPGLRAFALAALGAALMRRGALDEAERALEAAARIARGGSVEHGLVLVLSCKLRLARRDRRHAQLAATSARRVLNRHPDVGTLRSRLASVEATLARRGGQVLLGSEPTPAERRVLRLLDSDLTYGQIAARLYLSTETVHSHLRRLYRRLDAHSRQEAVDAARARGLLAA